MKKILLINGHPDKEGYNFALSEAYKTGAIESGAAFRQINIRELEFNPNLEFGSAYNFSIEPEKNQLVGAKFSTAGAIRLLEKYKIDIL